MLTMNAGNHGLVNTRGNGLRFRYKLLGPGDQESERSGECFLNGSSISRHAAIELAKESELRACHAIFMKSAGGGTFSRRHQAYFLESTGPAATVVLPVPGPR